MRGCRHTDTRQFKPLADRFNLSRPQVGGDLVRVRGVESLRETLGTKARLLISVQNFFDTCERKGMKRLRFRTLNMTHCLRDSPQTFDLPQDEKDDGNVPRGIDES